MKIPDIFQDYRKPILLSAAGCAIGFSIGFMTYRYVHHSEEQKSIINFDREPNSGEIIFFQESENEDSTKETTTFSFDKNHFHFATYWLPKSRPKGLVFLCHGLAEYIGPNYEEMAQYLCKEGYMIFGHDHRGHGRSSGPRSHVNSIDEYVKPVLAHVKDVKSWPLNKNKPIFLIGHSLGGLISLYTLLEEPNLFSGFIGIGPFVDTTLVTPFQKFWIGILKIFMPMIEIGAMKGSTVTRDEDVVKRNSLDPLTYQGGFRVGHTHVMLKSCANIQKKLNEIKLPILVLQGEKDELVSPEAAHKIVNDCSSTDKEFIVYPDAKHSLHTELPEVKQDVFNRISIWMKNHCKNSEKFDS